MRIYIVLFCAICIFIVYFIVNRTKMGLLLRATTQNREMFGAGPTDAAGGCDDVCAGGGLAGWRGGVPLYKQINPQIGQEYIVDSLWWWSWGSRETGGGDLLRGGVGFATSIWRRYSRSVRLLRQGHRWWGRCRVVDDRWRSCSGSRRCFHRRENADGEQTTIGEPAAATEVRHRWLSPVADGFARVLDPAV